MPLIITHYLLASRITEYVKKNFPEEHLDENALLWGGQGPDFMLAFKSNGENTMKDFADSIHKEDSANIISFISNYAKTSDNKKAKSYALGFFSYFATESICCPFVTYGAKALCKQKENMNEKICRDLIETNLDVIMLRYEKQMVTNELNLKKCAPKDKFLPQHIAMLYTFLGKSLFNRSYNMDNILKAVHDYEKELKKLNDYTGFKKDLIAKKERKHNLPPERSVQYRGLTEDDDFDYANISNKEWKNENKASTDNFMDLFEQAYSLSTAMTDCYFYNGDIRNFCINRAKP